MTIAEHVRQAIRQLSQGATIGRRQTPVISVWDMRVKWEKWGYAWTYKGRDGDAVIENNQQIVPAVLRLVYIRCADGKVVQLAYVEESERQAPIGSSAANRAASDYLGAPEAPQRLIA